MSITFSKPTFNSADPQPPIDLAERTRIREARDAQHQAVADAVDSLVSDVNSNLPTTGEKAAIKDITDAAGATTAGKLVGIVKSTIIGLFSTQAVASTASATGLTAGATYSYSVLTTGATYGISASGTGTGTEIMAMAASADLVLLLIKTAEAA